MFSAIRARLVHIGEKIKNGFRIMFHSFKVMGQDRKLWLFPLISFFSFLFVIAGGFLLVYSLISLEQIGLLFSRAENSRDFYTSLMVILLFAGTYFVLYFVCSLVLALISVASVYYISDFFENGFSSVSGSFVRAWGRIFFLVKWSLLAAAVGTILSLLRGKDEKGKRSAVSVLADFMGVAWSLATFFIYPILAFEDLGTFASVKRSSSLLKNTFGESVTADFGFGFLTSLIIFVFPVGWIYFISFIGEGLQRLLLSFIPINPSYGSVVAFAPAAIIPLFLLAVLSTVKIIFKTAVYVYAMGREPRVFPTQLIQASFNG